MMTVTDYTLINLFNASPADFETYMSAFLVKGVEDFKGTCDQDLSYTNFEFTEVLYQKNIDMLVLLMKKHWLEKLIDDIKQMNLAVTDKDFRRYAESQNMREKQNRYILDLEEVSQQLSNYALKHTIDWTQWFNGNFYVP
jgi:hypothetical protein